MTKLTKLFKNTAIKIAYKTNYNNRKNQSHRDNTMNNGIQKYECKDCNRRYTSQKKTRYFEHLNVYKNQIFINPIWPRMQ